MQQPETCYANVGDDRVAYQALGRGPPDLVHTIGFWSQVDIATEDAATKRFFHRLAAFGRVIWFDCRGSGLSDARPAGDREFSSYWCEDLIAVLDSLGSREATLVAVGDATLLALEFAAAHPDRCAGLVLANGTARVAASDEYPDGVPTDELAHFEEFMRSTYGTDKWTNWWVPSQENNPETRQFVSRWARSQVSPRTVLENIRASARMDTRHLLPHIKVPALVMTRKNYRMLPPAHGRYLARHIPGARFVELPGADGLLMFESPDEIVDLIEEFTTGRRHAAEPARAVLTMLFSDIVDSTRVAARIGDSAWRALLDRHDRIMREHLTLFGGKLIDHAGDGTLATFEHPGRAIDCACALRQAIHPLGLELRAGIHTAEVELREGGRIGGLAVHFGARVMAAASADEVLVSQTVHGVLMGSRYGFDERGPHELKGVSGRWPLYAVSGGRATGGVT